MLHGYNLKTNKQKCTDQKKDLREEVWEASKVGIIGTEACTGYHTAQDE